MAAESEVLLTMSKPQLDTKTSANTRLGVILVLCSCALFSGMHTSVRYASERLGFDPIFLAFARGVIQFTLLSGLIVFWVARGYIFTLPERTASFMLIRGLLGSLGMLLKYESLSRLPVGIAVSLFSTTPLFAAFFGFVFVGEVLSKSDVASMAICLCGGILVGVSDGPMELDGHVLGIVLAITAAAITALVFVTIRALGTQVHFFFSVQALSIGAICTPFMMRALHERDIDKALTFITQSFEKAVSTREMFLGVALVGCFAFSAAMCLNRALQLLGAGNAAIIRTLDIPVNFVTGFLVMGELPHATAQVIGCVLITLGIYINVAGKTKA